MLGLACCLAYTDAFIETMLVLQILMVAVMSCAIVFSPLKAVDADTKTWVRRVDRLTS